MAPITMPCSCTPPIRLYTFWKHSIKLKKRKYLRAVCPLSAGCYIKYPAGAQLTQRQLRLGRRPSGSCHDIVRRDLYDDLRQSLDETEGFLEAGSGVGEVVELLGQGWLCFWPLLLLLLLCL